MVVRFSDEPLIAADLSVDGSFSLLLDINQKLSFWDNNSLKIRRSWSSEDFSQVQYHAVLSGNNNVIATAGKKTVSILSSSTGELLARWEISGFETEAQVSQLLLDYTGEKVFIGLTEGSVIIVNLAENKRSLFKLHDGTVNILRMSKPGDTIFSSAFDGVVKQWQIDSGKVIWQRTQDFRITSLAIDEANKKVFISDALKNQRIYSLNISKENSQTPKFVSFNYMQRFRTFRQAIFIDHDTAVITSSSKYQISKWDSKTANKIAEGEIRGYSFGSTVLDFSINRQGNVLSLSSDGVLELWSTQ